uniref:Uncharacterized protein n=1 Tax=Opuntia streptacantha TaxID=393608 RepID=A0A7C9EFD4_OPUST
MIIDDLYGMSQLMVGILWRQFELSYQPVNLVDNHNNWEAFLNCMPYSSLSIDHYTFSSIHNQDSSICKPESSTHLIREVHVTRSIHDINQIRFQVTILKNKRHWHCLDRNPPLLLINSRIRISHMPLILGIKCRNVVSLLHKHVHEQCLPMMKIPNKSNITDQIRVRHETEQKLSRHISRRVLDPEFKF